MAKLIKKIVFDTDYYRSGDAVILKDAASSQNGLVLECSEDQMLIAVVKDTYKEDGNGEEYLAPTISNIAIDVQDVDQGEYSIDKQDDVRKPINMQEIYTNYQELSNSLAEAESIISEYSGDDDAEDISRREDERMENFKAILEKYS